MNNNDLVNNVKLHSNCIPVKGVARGIICDLQRNLYVPVPNSLIELFDASGIFCIQDLGQDEGTKQILQEYVDLLEKYEFIFSCDGTEVQHFPSLNLAWDFPGQATNCIIDINQYSTHDYNQLLNRELDSIGCRYIQVRGFTAYPMSFWRTIMKTIDKNEIRAVDFILMDESAYFSHEDVVNFVSGSPKIRSVILHSSAENKIISPPQILGFGSIVAIAEKINSIRACGNIHPSYFSINVENFSESHHHNTCLNRKISIDADGNIKNCPSMSESYGNIKDTSLVEAIEKPGFKKYWNITKDQIAVCKDCEFRHICTDCRAYLENPEDVYSKPLKCGYNPYTCEWEEWSTNPLKRQAIEFYGLNKPPLTHNQL